MRTVNHFVLLVVLLASTPSFAHNIHAKKPHLASHKSSSHHKKMADETAQPDVFTPPNYEDIPHDKYGDMVNLGRNIFVNTQGYAKRYVGNGLNCVSCHLAEGRKTDAAPLWGAYGMYPAYRNKSDRVTTYQERLQDCFRFSLNGIVPPTGSPEIQALVAYSHWLSTGAPVNKQLPGHGFGPVNAAKKEPSATRGADIYQAQCMICHGKNGEGVKQSGQYIFPPLWGLDSYNKGAGMHDINLAARFIKANMPPGLGNTLSDQDALDVSLYINRQFRPSDPRKNLIRGLMDK